ncbi:MAG: di-heme-cytochrome C peroxidase, partial [Verrucomicrobia bacterium]|nr:di-heme-cytochrome C peroxidase [Verrucomicrobiota bacterium]
FLWDTVKSNSVQWTGNAANGSLGSLGRNVGEVVGVFGAIDSGGERLPHGYASSVHFKNLKKLEKTLHTLKSPQWPTDVLPKIDQVKAKEGERLFKTHCASCHQKINPLSNWPILNHFVDSFKSQLTPLQDTKTSQGVKEGVKTDATAAELIRDSRSNSGKLSGQRRLFTLRDKYAKVEPTTTIVTDAVARVLIGMVEGKRGQSNTINQELIKDEGLKWYGDTDELAPLPVEEEADEDDSVDTEAVSAKGGDSAPLVYRARPLDGIWATGPFLHNGSVPTLFDLMLPAASRPKIFAVGHREFDPIKVGPVTTLSSDTFEFNTRRKGNSNKGHNYGASQMTDEQRWQLVEYLKTL